MLVDDKRDLLAKGAGRSRDDGALLLMMLGGGLVCEMLVTAHSARSQWQHSRPRKPSKLPFLSRMTQTQAVESYDAFGVHHF